MKLGRFSAIHAPTQRIYKRLTAVPAGPSLVLDLDAANYAAMPANGSTIAGTGAFAITTSNTNGSMAWAATAGGIFRKTTANDTDMLRFGPDYSSSSQAYTVMMVYRSVSGTAGRLLNANTASPDWLMGLWGNSGGVQDIFFNGSFLGSSSTAQTGAWRFAWMTSNGTTTTNAYAAGSTAPTGTHGTRAGVSGFNGLRLFGRYVSAVQNTEVVTADVGLVKVWDGALTLAEIQAQHEAYKTRFSLQLYLDAGNASSYSGSGTAWTDLSGNGRNGTLTNGPTYSSADGGSIVFDGTDDFVQCTGSVTATAATFIVWIRRNGDQGQYDGVLFSRGTSVSGMQFQSSNQLGYIWNNAVNTYNWNSGLTVPDLTWCMIAVSVTSTSATAYLCQSGGITSATNTVSHTSTTLDDIKIGQDDFGSRFFGGNIAIARLYDTALSADQISQLFDADKARFGY